MSPEFISGFFAGLNVVLVATICYAIGCWLGDRHRMKKSQQPPKEV